MVSHVSGPKCPYSWLHEPRASDSYPMLCNRELGCRQTLPLASCGLQGRPCLPPTRRHFLLPLAYTQIRQRNLQPGFSGPGCSALTSQQVHVLGNDPSGGEKVNSQGGSERAGPRDRPRRGWRRCRHRQPGALPGHAWGEGQSPTESLKKTSGNHRPHILSFLNPLSLLFSGKNT